MYELSHRVRVFVFSFKEARPHYLLLRSGHGIESFWTPLHGPIGFAEKVETAVAREVVDETGLGRPVEMIDLDLTSQVVLGDERVIEWSYGCRADRSDEPRLDPRWSEYRWAEVTQAFPALELEADRAALIRLHTLLHAA